MKISIIVCAYNGEADMPSCLESLVDQQDVSLEDYEVLIIDDGSTDQTGEVAKKFILEQAGKEILFRYIRIEHQGLSVGRNTGLFLASAPVVAYIDQDAVADKYWVSQLVKAWDDNPDADAIGGKINVRNEGDAVALFLHTVHYEPISKSGIIGTNMSFRKERLLEVGAFGDPFMSRGDDTFVTGKMGEGRKEVLWPEAVVFHDWPTSLKQWIKERGHNGELARVISGILGTKENPCRTFLARRSIVILLGGIVLALFPWMTAGIIPGILVLFAVKSMRNGDYKRLRRTYSVGRAAGLVVLCSFLKELGMWKFCIGWLRGSRILMSRETAMRGTVSDQYVAETFSSL